MNEVRKVPRALARQEEGGQFLLMDSVATSAGVDYTTLLLPRMKNKVRTPGSTAVTLNLNHILSWPTFR